MRLIILKIIKLLSVILILLLLTIPISNLLENASDKLRKSNKIQDNKSNVKDDIESNQEELQIKDEKTEEVVEENKAIIDNNTSTTSNISTPDNTKQENNNIKSNTTLNESFNNNVKVYEEIPKKETNNVNQYIGIPNPNDFYYSFHHGKIEYSNMDSCLADVPRISFKDTIDIINTWCIDVVDGQGTILGQYLYINCSSGNCDKYK